MSLSRLQASIIAHLDVLLDSDFLDPEVGAVGDPLGFLSSITNILSLRDNSWRFQLLILGFRVSPFPRTSSSLTWSIGQLRTAFRKV